jgi:type I restriction enzyme S subunit
MSWAEIALSELVEFSPKISLEKGELYDHIPMEAIDSGIKYPRETYQKEYTGGGTKFANGDTLFARITPCLENGKIAKVKDLEKQVGFGSTEYFVLRAKENISDSDFVYYLAKTDLVRQTAIKSMSGADGRQRADKGAVEQLMVLNIPLPTQRKIASILTAYDDLIENNLKRIKLLEEKAFLRYKQIVREEKFLQKAFNEVADYLNGYPFKPDDWKDEGLPIIKIKELKAGVQNDTPRNDGENIPIKYLIENKDILFAWSASIGAYLWCSGKSILNQHIFNVKPFDKDLHNWLYFSLLEKIPDFINLSNGATMQHIKKSALGMVNLPVPPKKVYQEFRQETDPILNLIVNLNQQNTKLREARDILLPKLMNGQIEV